MEPLHGAVTARQAHNAAYHHCMVSYLEAVDAVSEAYNRQCQVILSGPTYSVEISRE